MMIAPTGIVLGPRLLHWWTRLMDWMEIHYFPDVVARRKDMIRRVTEATRLQQWVEQHFP